MAEGEPGSAGPAGAEDELQEGPLSDEGPPPGDAEADGDRRPFIKDWCDTAVRTLGIAAEGEERPEARHVFGEIQKLKEGIDYEAEQRKHLAKLNDTVFAKIASNKYFECTTMLVIVVNALEIGCLSEYQAQNFDTIPSSIYENFAIFPVFEVFFCIYYVAELVIRFFAFKKKWFCLIDLWFLFDFVLVFFMFLETFILPFAGAGGVLSGLSILRLLRLLRITRMAKLMRTFPELMMILKGLAAAVRAVIWAAILMFLITFTFSILFTNTYHQGKMSDAEVDELEEVEDLFGSMGRSMLSLFVMGTMLDDITDCFNRIRATKNMFMVIVLIFYIIINSFMMFNMLVGILCDVVGNTKEGETRRMKLEGLQTAVTNMFRVLDKDHNGTISKEEYFAMKSDPSIAKCLDELDIREKEFEMYASLLFSGPNATEITQEKLVQLINRLQPGSAVCKLDFVSLKSVVQDRNKTLNLEYGKVRQMAQLLSGDIAWNLRFYDKLVDTDAEREDSTMPMDSPRDKADEEKSMVRTCDNLTNDQITNEIMRRLPGMVSAGAIHDPEELHREVRSAEAFRSLGAPTEADSIS